MEETEVVGNESEKNLEVAEQEEVVESTIETDAIDEVSEEVAEEIEEVEENQETKTKEEQSKEENAKYAMARRKAEEEAQKKIEQVRKEAYEQGLAQGKVQSYIGKQNPYTGQIINDDYDVQEYLDMFQLDSSGKDPIHDYMELQKDKARKEAEERVKADEIAKQNKWYEDDTKDFVEKYSSEKLQELTKDADFNMFAEGKIGRVPLSKIYESYQKLIGKYERKSVETAKKIVANNIATPGAIEESEVQELNWSSMPKEQFEKYLQKAKDGELK